MAKKAAKVAGASGSSRINTSRRERRSPDLHSNKRRRQAATGQVQSLGFKVQGTPQSSTVNLKSEIEKSHRLQQGKAAASPEGSWGGPPQQGRVYRNLNVENSTSPD